MLLNNTKKAVEKYKVDKISLAGGVSSNSYIRAEFDKYGKENGIEILYPELKLCTDNAAMIAAQGYYNFIAGKRGDLNLNAIPNLKLS